MKLTIELPAKLEEALQMQARKKGVSAAGFVEQVLEQILAPFSSPTLATGLPTLHLGAMDALHRRDIYKDVR